ncbi:MAG: hypothetical protein JG782_675 [Anaerophaga sp.]|nr:hypothetical protein [Anaerophaga sp.]
MKPSIYCNLLFVFLFLLPGNVFSFSFDDFPESWNGDTSLFILDAGQEMLRLNAPEETGEAFLYHPSVVFEDAVWEIPVKMDFNPSSSNYLQIYLATDGEKDFENGFYLVAGTSNDNISLWERREGEERLLIEGTEDLLNVSTVDLDIRVTRAKGGHWALEVNTGDGWQTEGEANSLFGFSAEFFGLSCHYTKTRSDKFYFGSLTVSGREYMDTIPPVIRDMEIVNGHTLNISFSEAVSDGLSQPGLKGIGFEFPLLQEISYTEDASGVVVKLQNVLPEIDDGQFIISGWCDANGACMEDTALTFAYSPPRVTGFYAENYRDVVIEFNRSFPDGLLQPHHFIIEAPDIGVDEIAHFEEGAFRLRLNENLPDAVDINCYLENLVLPNGDTVPGGPYSLYYHEAAPYDIVFSEIMHDPSPPALLPDAEYLELYNRSDFPVDLQNMSLYVNGEKTGLPKYLLFPDEYVVLTGSSEESFANALSLDKWHALTNSGGELVLKNPSGKVIAAFRYPALRGGSGFKQQGGWSMEIIDTENLSQQIMNWAYSIDEHGGTPGMPNSVAAPNPDIFPPKLIDAWLESDSVLILDFGEPLTHISVEEGRNDFSLKEEDIDGISRDSVFGDKLKILFERSLTPHNVEELTIAPGITDLAGNTYSGQKSLLFGLPGRIDSFDIVINELLFDPPAEGCDYVELFNRSAHIASLDSICLARAVDDETPEALFPLSDRIRWFLPGQYLCFTNDAEWVKNHFDCTSPDDLKEFPELPNYVNEGGTVFLTHLNGEIIDRFDYSPDMHFDLLSETRGIALERTSYDGPSNNPMMWHSAASTAGYGTPAAENSQFVAKTQQKTTRLFSLSPEIFTPDLDGVDDQLIISYAFDKPGRKGTFIVYDADGRQVRQLINNQTLNVSGEITWEGITDDHTQAPPGIYIVWARVFDPEGNVREYKESCVLGTRQK